MENGFEHRLLELHGRNMWNMFHVDRAIEFAKRYNMTGIIFHCNDLIDYAVFPTKFFSKADVMNHNPVKNSITKSYQYYLNAVLERCQAAGLEFYPEVKEINFDSDHFFSKYGYMRNPDGSLCATDPFWFEFVEEKFNEFLTLFPYVSGIIVSTGTRESKVTIARNQCTCERCRSCNPDDWYRKLIRTMFTPLDSRGKKLIIRDFAYNKQHQEAMLDASSSVSERIILSVKKAPHDFYPVSVDNPAIGRGKNTWVEFDTWGQFFGLGVFPCSIVEDIHERMKRIIRKGVSGVMVRTDWENMTQSSCFNSFNILNAIAAARFSDNLEYSDEKVYRDWCKYGLMSPLIPDSYAQEYGPITRRETVEYLRDMSRLGWKVIEKSTYARGMVFNINGQIFDICSYAYYLPTILHRRDDWEPGISDRLIPTEENIDIVIKEKKEGVKLARELARMAKNRPDDLPDRIKEYMKFLEKGLVLYTQGFELEARTALYVKRVEVFGDQSYVQKAKDTFDEYEILARKYDLLVKGRKYNHLILYMLDGDRLRRFKDSCNETLNSLKTAK